MRIVHWRQSARVELTANASHQDERTAAMTDELLTALKEARDYLEYLRKHFTGYSDFANLNSFATTQTNLNIAIAIAEGK